MLPDVTPLRSSREFTLLWTGQLVSQAGSTIRLVALPYQVYLLTGSSLAVGLIGLFSAVPLIFFSFFGGVIADRVDRRRLLLITQTCLALVSVALAVSAQAGVASVPLLYALTSVGACFGALDNPARMSLAPTLVDRRQIPAAMALNQTNIQLASVVGPALGGVIIAQVGLASAYWIDAATFAVAIVLIAAMRIPAVVVPTQRPHVLRSLAEGWQYLFSRPLLLATMSIDFFATFFGVARALMPYFADKVFHVGPEGLGLLYAAPGAGATLVVLTSGWTGGVQRKGLGVLIAVVVFGLATAAFGLVPGSMFLLGCACLAIAEGADTVSSIFRHTILQLEAPDAMRGRLSAINLLFVAGGPQLGQVEAGVVADLFTPEISMISGGVAVLGVVAVAASLAPEVIRYRTRFEEEELAPA